MSVSECSFQLNHRTFKTFEVLTWVFVMLGHTKLTTTFSGSTSTRYDASPDDFSCRRF